MKRLVALVMLGVLVLVGGAVLWGRIDESRSGWGTGPHLAELIGTPAPETRRLAHVSRDIGLDYVEASLSELSPTVASGLNSVNPAQMPALSPLKPMPSVATLSLSWLRGPRPDSLRPLADEVRREIDGEFGEVASQKAALELLDRWSTSSHILAAARWRTHTSAGNFYRGELFLIDPEKRRLLAVQWKR